MVVMILISKFHKPATSFTRNLRYISLSRVNCSNRENGSDKLTKGYDLGGLLSTIDKDISSSILAKEKKVMKKAQEPKGKKPKKKESIKMLPHKVFIPTKPDSSLYHEGDYSEHIDELYEIIEAKKYEKEDPKSQFLCSLVDGMNANPDYSIEQKKEAIQTAIEFFEGKPLDLKVKSLEGHQQYFINRK